MSVHVKFQDLERKKNNYSNDIISLNRRYVPHLNDKISSFKDISFNWMNSGKTMISE